MERRRIIMHKNLIKSLIIFGILLIVILGVWFYFEKNATKSNISNTQEDSSEIKNKTEEKLLYADSIFGFSFYYPKGFLASSFQDSGGQTVLVQSQGSKEGVQIFAFPFEEEGPITIQRIKKDLPDLKTENIKTVIVGNLQDSNIKGEEAISFESRSETNEQTYEIWFLHNNVLYQLTTLVDNKKLIDEIVKTWKFN